MKKAFSFLLTFVLMVSLLPNVNAANSFTDVSRQDYFYNAVYWAVDNEITTGTSATTFSPMETCTRGQVVTFLWRKNGEPKPSNEANPFVDVNESDYFYQAVLWAVERDITTGTSDTTFSPSATCTYAQVVTFLWRASGQLDVYQSRLAETYEGEYFKNAVAWADVNGILAGSKNEFIPSKPCPRADIVTYIYYDILKTYNLADTSLRSNSYYSFMEIDGKLYEMFWLNERWPGFEVDKITGEIYVHLDTNKDSSVFGNGIMQLAAYLEGNYDVSSGGNNPYIEGIITIDYTKKTALEMHVDTQYTSAVTTKTICSFQKGGKTLQSSMPKDGNYSVQDGIRCIVDKGKNSSVVVYNLNDLLEYFGYKNISVSSDFMRDELDGNSVLIIKKK